jgi:hypothetical protein
VNPYIPVLALLIISITLTEQKVLSFARKNKKNDFEDLKEMNNFLHRNVLRFRMDLELKFTEVSKL